MIINNHLFLFTLNQTAVRNFQRARFFLNIICTPSYLIRSIEYNSIISASSACIVGVVLALPLIRQWTQLAFRRNICCRTIFLSIEQLIRNDYNFNLQLHEPLLSITSTSTSNSQSQDSLMLFTPSSASTLTHFRRTAYCGYSYLEQYLTIVERPDVAHSKPS